MCKNGVKKISFSSYCKSKLWDHVLAIVLENIYIYNPIDSEFVSLTRSASVCKKKNFLK